MKTYSKLSFHKKFYNNKLYYSVKNNSKSVYLNLENCILAKVIENRTANIYYSTLSKPEYLTYIKELEENVIAYIKENSSGLFSINITSNDIANLFFSNIDNDNLLIVQDYNNTNLDINLKYNIKVKVNGIWFRNDTFGISYLIDRIYN